MKKSILKLSLLISVTAIIAFSLAATTQKKAAVFNQNEIKPGNISVYDFKVKTIDGDLISLSKYKGKKLLIVNVASECGYTPQYKNLQALSEQFASKLVVIGFPANNFGAQEPGTGLEIKAFCTKNYGVTFPMMEKISVKGGDMHPLYKWLSTKAENGVSDDAPRWNFGKYLVDENGNLMRFFGSKVDPLSAEITSLL